MSTPLTRDFIEQIPSTGEVDCIADKGSPIRIYPRSPLCCGGSILFVYRGLEGRRIASLSPARERAPQGLEAEASSTLADGSHFASGPLSHGNAEFLREAAPFTAPSRVGPRRSFGLGDRLGLAGPAHLRSIEGTGLFPVLAQQSIRELERTSRTPEEVLDCATFSVFQESHQQGFAADGDHLKTTGDIDRVLNAGYTFFTFDPGDLVDNDADHLDGPELGRRLDSLPWGGLERTAESFLQEYRERSFSLPGGFQVKGLPLAAERAAVKYGRVLVQLRSLFEHLARRRAAGSFQVEISVDETDAVTSPFEHFLLMSELRRLRIQVDSLAPRFVGRFEKGIDFRGDLGEFEAQFSEHVAVRDAFGGYRLSLHSGSDKFSVYPIFARLGGDQVHVKTAGTSYLEALRALIRIDAPLFRSIFAFSRDRYADARASYHVSADLSRVPEAAPDDPEVSDRLLSTNDDLRQVLHVAFGDVLTHRGPDGNDVFKSRLLAALDSGEATHFACLEEHFARHIAPFRTSDSE